MIWTLQWNFPEVAGGDMFSKMDKDGSGGISREEFAQAPCSVLDAILLNVKPFTAPRPSKWAWYPP